MSIPRNTTQGAAVTVGAGGNSFQCHGSLIEQFPQAQGCFLAQVCLAIAVALTLWSGWEFYRDVWKQRASLRG